MNKDAKVKCSNCKYYRDLIKGYGATDKCKTACKDPSAERVCDAYWNTKAFDEYESRCTYNWCNG